MSERPGGTVTFVYTDIEGSTRLLKQLGRERYAELLERHQALLRDAFPRYGGEEIDTHGDAFFVAFRSATSAVSAAVEIQRALAKEQWPDNVAVLVRIGIHTAEADAAGDRYIGLSVHRATHVGEVGHGGQVLVSSSTQELVADDLPAGVVLRDLGLYRLKDVERPERIAQVMAEGLRSEFPPLRGAAIVKQPRLRRRRMLASALVGVVAAAIAVPLFALGSNSPHTSQPSPDVAVSCSNTAAAPKLDGARLDLTGVYRWPALPGFHFYVRQAGTCVYEMYQYRGGQGSIAGTFTGGIEPNLNIAGIWSDVPYASIQGHGRLVQRVTKVAGKLVLVAVSDTGGWGADNVVQVKRVAVTPPA
ncbi:MAG TPA: adenylate/guanylate cyclase domain-containing protein [Gaiellaceae bacterium]|nr:adenylate/guanylate cyclase domain-containing protein [Gaiellaceae bacterium]